MLVLIATPLGNIEDMSPRAVETLRGADLIAAEDTRKTGQLLKHFDIGTPQMPFHEHNEAVAAPKILRLLEQGKTVAAVTDSGTPGVSDPGYRLVRLAVENDIPVTMVPGPSALVAAVVLSGLPLHSFTFRGFPPRKSGARRRFFEVDAASPHTLIYYESPYRLRATLVDALAVFGDRLAALANDLTKKYESVHRGSLSALIEDLGDDRPLGEFVLVIAGLS